jgi:hypothetical protein
MPQEYQRLVANPFLALAALIAWGAALRLALIWRDLVASIIVVAGFFVVVGLIHYHCLDCGRTGWLFRWRRHACDTVLARQATGQARRWRGPTPGVQAVIWLYALACAALVLGLSGMFSRH